MSYTYDENNNRLTEKLKRTVNGSEVTETTTHEYNARDQLVKTTDALGNITQYEYDLKGQESAMIDALGRRMSMSYDAYNRLTSTTYADTTSMTHTYDVEGNKLSDTDRQGRTTRYAYDALNRVIKTTYPDGGEMSSVYDAAGRMASSTDARGNKTTYEYDNANRRTAVVDALTNRHATTYDAAGNITREVDGRGNAMSYTYNALDQRTQMSFADATSTTDTLDALGRRTAQTDEASIATSYAYDELGRLTSVTDAAGNITRYTYDEAGNKLTQTDAAGRTTRWAYDALGRPISRTLPLGQRETYGYDANSNRTSHTDFNGQTHTFAYDINDRLTTETYADGSITAHVYDALGNRTQSSITDTNGTRTWRYQYDTMNRLTQDTKPNGATLEYAYDKAGNKTQLITTLSDGTTETIAYTYDALNRLASVTNDEGTSTYGYDEIGNRTSLSYPNGTSQTWAYDTRNRLTAIKIYNANGAVIQSFDYTLHPTGRRTKITELDGRTSDYTYNDRYWLTSENITDTTNGNYNASYSYDTVGNRLQGIEAGVTTQYQYDDNDRITQQGGVTYSYDDNGNTLQENDQGLITSYGYNAQNQLATHTKNGTTTNYRYDAAGIRHGQANSSEDTEYFVDSNRAYAQVLSETINGSLDVAYHYGDDLISQERGNDSHYFHVDGLGSSRLLSDSSGSPTNKFAYGAFGNILSQAGLSKTDYLYTGEQFDITLDHYYLRSRYFDIGSSRFTQLDTWPGVQNNPVTLNKYLYGGSDPISYVDPTGQFFTLSGVSSVVRTIGVLARSPVMRSLYGSTVRNGARQGLKSNRVRSGLLLIGGLGGLKLYNMMYGSDVTTTEVNAAENAGNNASSDQISRRDRRKKQPRRAVIGENQGRVISAAKHIGARYNELAALTIKYTGGYVYENGNLTPRQEILSIAFNKGWIRNMMKNRADIFDIGRDPSRVSAGVNVSPWYAMERYETRAYPYKHFMKWP